MKYYDLTAIRSLLPDGEEYGEVTMQLAKGESAWNCASTKRNVYGPCTLVTQIRVSDIQQFVL